MLIRDRSHMKDLCHTVYRGLYLHAAPDIPSETADALPKKSQIRELFARHLGFRSYSGLAHGLPLEIDLPDAQGFIEVCLHQKSLVPAVTLRCFGLPRDDVPDPADCPECGAIVTIEQAVECCERDAGYCGDLHGMKCPHCGTFLGGYYFQRNPENMVNFLADSFAESVCEWEAKGSGWS